MPTLYPLLRHAVVVLLAILCMSPSTAGAGDELLRINMRDAEMRAVIQWFAEQMRKQIVIDPRVRGRMTVLADQPMNVEQAYEIFLTALEVHGFAASEHRGVLRIVPANQLRDGPRDLVRELEQLEHGQQVIHVVSLNTLPAGRAQALIEPLTGPYGRVMALPTGNALLLADDGAQVKRLVELLRLMDDNAPVHLEIVNLRHADAGKAVGLVHSLFPAGTTRTEEQPLSVTADLRSNSVLIAGDTVRRNQVIDLLERIDQPLDSRGETRVIYLNYLNARELEPVLKGMAVTMQEESRDQRVQSVRMSIEAAEATNALVLAGPPNLLQDLADVIAQLDVRRPQVLLEAIIVELNQQRVQSLGVEWNTALNTSGLEAATRFGLRDDNAGAVAQLLGPGLALGFYRHGNLRALLRALTTTSDANILSTPSIVTLDNQQARILVGSNIPIVTGQATGNAAQTDNPFTTFERQDIGVTLTITPQINRDDAITLEILQEVEHLADRGSARDVVTNKRSIATRVVVDNDTILAIGGLVSDERRERVSKVPVLGSLPWVGRLFQTTTEESEQRNLIVFIHPLILNDATVADALTKRRHESIRRQQQGLKPPPTGTPLLDDYESLLHRSEVDAEFETVRPAGYTVESNPEINDR